RDQSEAEDLQLRRADPAVDDGVVRCRAGATLFALYLAKTIPQREHSFALSGSSNPHFGQAMFTGSWQPRNAWKRVGQHGEGVVGQPRHQQIGEPGTARIAADAAGKTRFAVHRSLDHVADIAPIRPAAEHESVDRRSARAR